MKNILILGGAGYVGSRLRQVLAEQHQVDSVDIGWFGVDANTRQLDYHNLTREELTKYDAVVVLAAHAGVKPCEGDMLGPWLNNVSNFVELLRKLDPNQLVIYASSASVYGNSLPGQRHTEQLENFIPVNNYDLNKYTLDLHAEIAIREGRQVVGLRFGTVNGWSPVLRVDVMINAMYHSALTNQKITVFNKDIGRALLGIEDLCRAMTAIIDKPVPGIYNLASFNTTVSEIANTVAQGLSVPVEDKGSTDNVYDFGIDTRLFEQTYNFTFTETPSTIVDSLVKKYAESATCKRDTYINYNWN